MRAMKNLNWITIYIIRAGLISTLDPGGSQVRLERAQDHPQCGSTPHKETA